MDKDSRAGLLGVVTTIQEPTASLKALTSCLNELRASLIVVGDQKGPSTFDLAGTEFLSLKDQLTLEFDLAGKLPTGHYTRKNIGYLVAIKRGAASIYETDDDNAPMGCWKPRDEIARAISITGKGWVNVYSIFGGQNVWPRGFPLDEIRASIESGVHDAQATRDMRAPIQQGLVNNSPDVDAIWRLVNDKPFDFHPGQSVYLSAGAWCPFNSQSTWWFPAAYPLMYLPSYCSFRMTDIWRSFIAQRCLWEMGFGVVFHGPEVVQDRNPHDLMRDFADEIPGYTRNKEMIEILEGLSLAKGESAVGENMMICYEALVKAEFFRPEEFDLVKSWLYDLSVMTLGWRNPAT